MDAIIGGALIGGGAQLIGGALSGSSAAAAARQQYKYQKRFAKKAIQWRVQDAKKAGLHPLYALGAQVPSYSPVSQDTSSMGDALAAAGQNIGNAISRRLTPAQQQALELEHQQKLADIRYTNKQADYLDTEMARIRSDRLRAINEIIAQPIPDANVKESGSAGTFFAGQAIRDTNGVPAGYIEPKAPVSYSPSLDNAGVAAGTSPMMRQFTLPDGMPILLPGGMQGDPSEALESLTESPILMWSVYKANRERFGPEWASRFRARYLWGDSFESFWKWSARNRGRPAAPRTHRTRQDYR